MRGTLCTCLFQEVRAHVCEMVGKCCVLGGGSMGECILEGKCVGRHVCALHRFCTHL